MKNTLNEKNSLYQSLKERACDEKTFFKGQVIPSGTVYTPDHLSDLLVEQAIKSHVEIHGLSLDNSDDLLSHLMDLSVLDLACGTGQLVMSYIEFLRKHIAYAENFTLKDLWRYVKRKIYCVDVDRRSIETLRELILCYFHEVLEDSEDDQLNLYCKDSLMDDLEIPLVDIIIGNPPYIGEKGHTDVFEEIKSSSWGKKYYEGKMDYFYFFIYRGYDYLKEDGVLTFLTSRYFFTADGAKKLRRFLKDSFFFRDLIVPSNDQWFGHKGLHPCIYSLSKEKPLQVNLFKEGECILHRQSSEDIFDHHNLIHFSFDGELLDITKKIKKNQLMTLSEGYSTMQGIVSGLDRVKDSGVFVYESEKYKELPAALKDMTYPFYKNSAIKHYSYEEEAKYILVYSTSQCSQEAAGVLEQYLYPYKEQLMKRREVIRGVRKWYELTWPRKKNAFIEAKIVAPQRAKSNYFAYVEKPFFASADVYYIHKTSKSPYSLKTLMLILNSGFYFFWLREMGKRKGPLLELYATPLKQIPIPDFHFEIQAQLESLSNKVIANKGISDADKHWVDEIIMNGFALNQAEKKYIRFYLERN